MSASQFRRHVLRPALLLAAVALAAGPIGPASATAGPGPVAAPPAAPGCSPGT